MLWQNNFPRNIYYTNISKNKDENISITGDGLNPQILKEYCLTPESSKKYKNGWILKEKKKEIRICKFSGDKDQLLTALEWQEYLAQNNCHVLKPQRTKDGKLYTENNKEMFFVIEWVEGQKYVGKNEAHLLACFKGLGKIHKLTENYSKDLIKDTTIDWAIMIQKKLTDLLQYHRSLRGKIRLTDFERLFVEYFDYFYNSGQEAVESMVLIQVDSAQNHLLVNNFVSNDLLVNDNKVIFTSLLKWGRGSKILDVVLLVNSYLPGLRWNPQVFQKLLKAYEESEMLTKPDEQVLLALLRFPGRFWLYSWQYFVEGKEEKGLSKKLKNYICESFWRDYCLNTIEAWLWEG